MDLNGLVLADGARASLVATGVPERSSAQQADGQRAGDMMAQLLKLLKAWPGAIVTIFSTPR